MGGGGATTTSYSYTAAVILGLCEGPIIDVSAMWASKLKYSGTAFSCLANFNLAAMVGSQGQSPVGYITSSHPDEAIGYSGLAYVWSPQLPLDDNASTPNFTFEVVGQGILSGQVDADPSYIINDLLTNVYYSGIWPSQYIGTLTDYQNYTRAAGLFISPVLSEQKQAADWLNDIGKCTNSEFLWSNNKLYLVPYADSAVSGNGYSYTPNLTAVYDLGPDDFLVDDGSEPITCTRKSPADAYNHIRVEYLDRRNDYNTAIAEAKDLADIQANGLRTMDTVQLHMICDSNVARIVAQLLLQRVLYIRNTYTFKLGWKYGRLQPMDLVTLTDSLMGLNKKAVRITEIDDSGDDGSGVPGVLTVTAGEFPVGVSSHALYEHQTGLGYIPNYSLDPGNVNEPILFEPPFALQTSSPQLEAWMAVSGASENWGGCNIWVSLDGASYSKIGTVQAKSRQGALTSTLASGSDPDTTNTLAVDLTESGGQLLSGTQGDADNGVTLCYVDGEIIAYQTSVLTSANHYNLNYLRRGMYGTAIGSHASASKFARLDAAIFKYPYQPNLIGQQIYFKFQSFNIYGAGLQDLSMLTPYQYPPEGMNAPGNVLNLTSYYVGSLTYLKWDAVADPRSLVYEIRMGADFNSAIVVGTVSGNTYLVPSNGTFWVVAKSGDQQSATPADIAITGSVITANILATYDEAATGWTGTLGGAAASDGSGHIWLNLGSGLTGTYEIPTGHQIDVGAAQNCQVSCNFLAVITNPSVNFESMASVDGITDFDTLSTSGTDFSGMGDVQIQIALSQNGTTWGDWQAFNPGTYKARKFKMRAILTSYSTQLTPLLTNFSYTVDLPSTTQTFTSQAIAAGGTSLTYTKAFHQQPNVQVTILNPSAGDYISITNNTTTGFTLQVLNGGSGVARTVNTLSQGY